MLWGKVNLEVIRYVLAREGVENELRREGHTTQRKKKNEHICKV